MHVTVTQLKSNFGFGVAVDTAVLNSTDYVQVTVCRRLCACDYVLVWPWSRDTWLSRCPSPACPSCPAPRQYLSSRFDWVVPSNELKWSTTQDGCNLSYSGNYSRQQVLVDFLLAQGFQVKGHEVFWNNRHFEPDCLRVRWGVKGGEVWGSLAV